MSSISLSDEAMIASIEFMREVEDSVASFLANQDDAKAVHRNTDLRCRTPPIMVASGVVKCHVDISSSGKPIARKKLVQSTDGSADETKSEAEIQYRVGSNISKHATKLSFLSLWPIYQCERAHFANRLAAYLRTRFDNDAPGLVDFEGDDVPDISVEDYIDRMIRYADMWAGDRNEPQKHLGMTAALVAIEYIDRLNRPISMKSVHRLLMCGFFIGIKITEDFKIASLFWSKVGGVELDELNIMENQFCLLLKWRLNISETQFRYQHDRFI